MSYTAISPVNTVTGTSNEIVIGGTSVNPTFAIANNPILPGTGSVQLPEGNTAARAGAAGSIRFNTQLTVFEATPDGATWYPFSTSSGTVNSVTGTTNEITASPTTGAVILTIPSTFIAPGTLAAVTSISAPEYLVTGSGSGVISILPQAAAGTYNLNLPITAGTSGYLLTSAGGGSSPMTWSNIATIAVSSISGTANEITASASTGAVTLSVPSTFIAPGTIAATTSISAPIYLVTGSGSGTISILPQAAAGTYNLNLPITAGTSGYFLTSAGGAGSPMTWTNPSSIITPAALTKTDDTNVTLTLGGSPTTALLQATSLTLGWTGQLGLTRGGTAASLTADFGGIVYSTASALAILASTSTARQILMSGASTAPAWSTATYPATTTVSQLLYSSSANVIAGLATANSAALVTTVGGVPIFSSSLSDGQVIIGVSGGTPVAASLSAGSGVTITPGAGTISIAATGSGGTVTSVSGTANQIDSTGGNTPVLSLSSTTIFPGTVTLHADPVSALQAVTKQYADAIAAGLEFKNACVCASTVALTVTYNNNASGIGATLTNATTQAAFSVDGQSPTLGQRVLIKNQASTFQNGIYTVTVVGTGATNWVLTRSLDFDQPSEIAPGDLVPVIAGTVNADTLWLQTQTVATIGTDAIVFSQFSSAPLTLPVSMANGGTNASLTANNGGIFYSTASAGAILSGTATARQMLQSGASTTPAWSTTTWPATTTANRILYSSSTSVIGEITSANSATLVTNSSGVPALTSSMTDGQILIGSTGGTPAPATLTAGSNVTITNASGSITIASTGGSGGSGSGPWVAIASQSASSSSTIDFVGLSSTYLMYMVVIDRALPSTDGVALEMRASTDNGSTYYNTNEYSYANMIPWDEDGSYNSRGGSGTAAVLMTGTDSGYNIGNAANRGITGQFYIYNPSGTSYGRTTGSFTYTTAGGAERASSHAGSINVAADIDAIRFLFSSGNIASGTFTLYGLLQSGSAGTGVGGSLTYITSQTASSSSSLDFVNYFSSQYDGYLFEFIGVLPATNTDQLYMLMGTGGTPTYASTGYLWQNWSSYVGTGNSAQGSSNDTQWKVCAPDAGGVSNSSTYNGIYGNLNLYGTNTSSSVASGTCLFACYSTSASGYANTSCTFNIGAATYTAARFKFSSGNIASGTIRMYGITNGTPVGTNGPIPWIDQTSTSATMVINTGYVADNGSLVTLTVPATVPFGSVLAIAGKGAGGWKIQMNTGQTADLGSSATTSAGSLASTNQYDAIELVCVTANTTFVARSAVGNITLA